MKSTSIESLIDEKIDEVPNQEKKVEEFKNDEIQSELLDQLESLKSELSSIKNPPEEFTIKENAPATQYKEEMYTNPIPPNIDSSKDNEKTLLEKFYNLEKNDIKEIVILFILYFCATNPLVNETIDNLIPYSLYSYNFVIKALLVIIVFRVLKLIQI